MIELLVALAAMGIIVAVLASLISAGMKSFTVTQRGTSLLTNARQALDQGNGSLSGMLWSARNAASFQDLSTTSLDLVRATGAGVQFSSDGKSLYNATASGTQQQAPNITSLQVTYYNMDSSGHVMVSTVAANAIFAATFIQNTSSNKTPYYFYGGARLRNHS